MGKVLKIRMCSMELTHFKNRTEGRFHRFCSKKFFEFLKTTRFRSILFVFRFTILLFTPLSLRKWKFLVKIGRFYRKKVFITH